MDRLISILSDKKYTISIMESCTGGCIAHEITNIEGASDIFKFGAVTYSNEFKIKMGVSADIIDKYTVYSIEVAKNMAKVISDYTNSTFGVGVTGKLNREDKNNLVGSDDMIYVSIYNKLDDTYSDFTLKAEYSTRIENKEMIVRAVIGNLLFMLGE